MMCLWASYIRKKYEKKYEEKNLLVFLKSMKKGVGSGDGSGSGSINQRYGSGSEPAQKCPGSPTLVGGRAAQQQHDDFQ